VSQTYLIATSNFDSPVQFDNSPEDAFADLEASGRVSRDCFGFLRELDPDRASDITSLAKADVERASLHKLMRFCVAHGVRVGHDTRRAELAGLVRWIIGNESDGVSLRTMPAMMQQAIDLAVLAQNVERFQGGAALSEAASEGRRAEKEMGEKIERARREGVALGEAAPGGGSHWRISSIRYYMHSRTLPRSAHREGESSTTPFESLSGHWFIKVGDHLRYSMVPQTWDAGSSLRGKERILPEQGARISGSRER
jgi:hypothetical protein